MEINRYCVVGDIHGTIDELEELLTKLEDYKPYKLYSCGDLIDRGRDPAAVVRKLMSLGAVSCQSNHCDKWYRWVGHERNRELTGKKNPISVTPERLEQWKDIPIEYYEYLKQTKPIVDLGSWGFLVHGGMANAPKEAQDPKTVIRMRYVDKDTGWFSANHKNPKGVPVNAVPWEDKWTGPRWVVCGHNVVSLTDPKVQEKTVDNRVVKTFHLDTGCVFGGRLTAAVFEEVEGQEFPNYQFIQVPARKQYWDLQGRLD